MLAFAISCSSSSRRPANEGRTAEQRCEPQQCTGDGVCDAMLANGEKWIWTGRACLKFYESGCTLVGRDCLALHADESACRIAFVGCEP